jgi:hypothetical protein
MLPTSISGNVVYIMEVVVEKKKNVKLGYTDNIRRRLREHCRDYIIEYVWSIIPFCNAKDLESEMKDQLFVYNTKIDFNGKTRVELYEDISPGEVDDIGLAIRQRMATEQNIDIASLEQERCYFSEMKHEQVELQIKHLESTLKQREILSKLKDKEIEIMRFEAIQALKISEEMKNIESIREKTREYSSMSGEPTRSSNPT